MTADDVVFAVQKSAMIEARGVEDVKADELRSTSLIPVVAGARRGGSDPIGKLTSVILARIFQFLVDCDHQQHHRPVTGPQSPYYCIILAHVCRRWRTVMLLSPQLWRRLVVGDVRMTKMALKLSEPELLRVTAYIPLMKLARAKSLSCVLAETRRMKSLRLTMPGVFLSKVESLYSEPANALEELCIFDCDYRLTAGITIMDGVVRPGLFKGHTPLLRKVHFHRVHFHWADAIFCPSITHLEVSYRAGWLSQVGRFDELVKTLAKMPGLQELSVEGGIPCLPDDVDELPEDDVMVSLCALKRLSLMGDAIDVARFLKNVSLPSVVRVTVDGRYRSSGDHGLQLLMKFFFMYACGSRDPIQSVTVRPVAESKYVFYGWRQAIQPSEVETSHDISLRISGEPDGTAFQTFVDECPVFPQVVSLNIEASASGWELPTLVKQMPSLKRLAVTGNLLSPDYPTLVSRWIRQEDIEAAFSCGSLETVHLESVRLGCAHPGHPLVFLDGVVSGLRLRMKRGMPMLKLLSLEECSNGTSTDIGQLREVAEVVKWDGYENIEFEDPYFDSDDDSELSDDENEV